MVRPIVEGELGFKMIVVDGYQPLEHARIDQEIFEKLHRSQLVIDDTALAYSQLTLSNWDMRRATAYRRW